MKDIHSFNINIAQQYGINCAILLQNIFYWVNENKAKASEKHFHNEHYWTYNSIKQFSEQFPYISSRQIRSALEILEQNNLILIDNFNTTCSRTLWYTVTDKAIEILTGQTLVQEDVSYSNEKDASEDFAHADPSERDFEDENVQKCQNDLSKMSNSNIQKCQNDLTNLQILTNNIPQNKTTNDIEKEIYKEKETPERQIFDFWNSKQLLACSELSNYLKEVISTALKSFSLEDIKLYISRYAEVYNSKYVFDYPWSLKNFISRNNAMKEFADNGEKWQGYINWKKSNSKGSDSFIHNNYTAEQIAGFYTNLDEVEV